jgi:NAD dependent epimerase/dehydratase family enzyme
MINNKNISGTFNAVSPEHITNIELTKKIRKVLIRPIFLPNIPKFMIQALFGAMSIILLEGIRVSSDKIVELGFSFNYGNLTNALINLLQAK